MGELSLGQWIGVLQKFFQMMSYWILTVSREPISSVNVKNITELEKKTNEYKEQMEVFDKNLDDRIKAKEVE